MSNDTPIHQVSRQSKYQIGIDFGGTKIEVILLDRQNRELFRKRLATPVNTQDNYKNVIEIIHTLINQALTVVSMTDDYTVGVGIPGTMDKKTGIVQNANTTWLAGHDFKADLEHKLHKSVFMDNDANCFVLAESLGGAAKGYNFVFGIIMGTGCGGGFSINGTIHNGNHGIAGEWGHIIVDPQGDRCFCGHTGCINTKLTGPGLARAYKNLTQIDLSAEQIVSGARNKDKYCQKIFDQFLDDFGRSVGGLVSLLDPDAIVLGGGLSNISELYTIGIEKIKSYAFHENLRTPILKNTLGDSAGAFGAAWLGSHTFH